MHWAGPETKSTRQALPCPVTGGLVDVVRGGWSGKGWFGEVVVRYEWSAKGWSSQYGVIRYMCSGKGCSGICGPVRGGSVRGWSGKGWFGEGVVR